MLTLSKSSNYKEEYSCSIIKIGELHSIEGSDFLVKTLINGFPVVIRKDEVKEGDLMFYVSNECQLNSKFLEKNNLYEDYELNSNAKEYEKVLEEKGRDEARKLCGYIPKTGRIRIIKLRGCPSMGLIFSLDSMKKWKDGFNDFNLEEHIGEFFDTVNDDLFVKAYVPYVKESHHHNNKYDKRNKKLKKFDRMVTGQFRFHYDTNQLQVNVHRLAPDTKVSISTKVHGTSAIFANVLVKKPLSISLGQKTVRKSILKKVYKERAKNPHRYNEKKKINNTIDRYLKILKPSYSIDYGNIYASRTVIKNQYINRKVSSGFYETDVWGYVNNLIKKYIPKDMIIYGEIVGYIPNNSKMIQKNYDYGCAIGTCKLMIYRITMNRAGQEPLELDLTDVIAWTNKLLKKAPHLQEYIMPIDLLYVGTLRELYPNLDTETHWNENVLELLKQEKRFHMEENEPLNKTKMPREGIVVRILEDPVPEAFKLKCIKFLQKEAAAVDKGEVDIEMDQTDY